MRCPVDQAELVMSERQGVEIDYCPSCRGVWLDRGELDKIIDRTGPGYTAGSDDRRSDDRRAAYPTGSQHHGQQQGQQPRRKKKESWLGELFEFGG